jgi:uncharacterized membrane protein YhaH (DUF805 family)
MNWYLEVLRKYAVFRGRARRREYWIFEVMNSVIAGALFVLAVVLGKAGYPYFLSLPVLYLLATAIPSLSSSVRRLHDTGRSGWWLWISGIPAIGPIVVVAFMVQDSQPGENRYGPNPKERYPAESSGGFETGYLAPPIDGR